MEFNNQDLTFFFHHHHHHRKFIYFLIIIYLIKLKKIFRYLRGIVILKWHQGKEKKNILKDFY